jgi:hypothetical protein
MAGKEMAHQQLCHCIIAVDEVLKVCMGDCSYYIVGVDEFGIG